MVRRDDRTMDLLAWAPPQVAAGYEPRVAGRGSMANQIARLVGQALRDATDECGVTRSQVAAAMSLDLERSISEDMLNKWASEAATGHRIPTDAFVSLVKVLKAKDLLGFIPAQLDYVAVPKKYADIIEMHLIEEKERDLVARKHALAARLRSGS
ncbi:hypothetical protein [Devosia sp.]|uniref:hypothetical protein n=1 Tax=Devosia sp. TaxID=1871048 RepID=UPI001AC1068B|nr:hypothetical protein [Devosia sp.]MBN9333265.1 hypothetical protein [Devosia sp.]